MKHYKLIGPQKSGNLGRFTDVFEITKADLTEGTDNTAQAVTLMTLAKHDTVMQTAIIQVTEAWAGDAQLTATCSIGVTGTATALTPALTICTTGTGAEAGTGDTSDNQTNAHYRAAAAIDVIATFTPDADSALDEFTAGKLVVLLEIVPKTDIASLQL